MAPDSGIQAHFAAVAPEVNSILERRGYQRLPVAGWCWEHGRSRVQLSCPASAAPMMPFLITRQRYDMTPDGEPVLLPQSQMISVGYETSAEKLADAVEEQLKSPW